MFSLLPFLIIFCNFIALNSLKFCSKTWRIVNYTNLGHKFVTVISTKYSAKYSYDLYLIIFTQIMDIT